ncbi:hypothetical protein MIS45_09985 [Wielerella bovis]|uniref:hypothetical protein n=1 Tax=Wielerella bovis TaxID=2917790 RepID=UPI002018720F|nr:hypothetical protein [Wielerella bovis]ULJ69070.1 hypothetical protein MIS45_09985 [Wielerella bovis]
MSHKTHLSLAIAAIALAACQSVTPQSADQLARYSMQRQFSDDYRYNFSGSAQFQINEQTREKLNQTADKVAADASDDVVSRVEGIVHDDNYRQHLNEAVTAVLKMLAQSTRLNYTGAVDLSQGKMEIVPQLEQSTQRNVYSSIKMPMQLNVKHKTLYVDPEAITYFTDPFMQISQLQPINGRLVSFTLPEKWQHRVPFQTLAKAYPKALDDGYASLPAESYQFKPVDEMGHKLGASKQIELDLTMAQMISMSQVSLQSLHDQVAAAKLEEGVSEEDRDKTLLALSELAKMNAGKPRNAEDKMDKFAQLDRQTQTLLKQVRYRQQLYVDGKGRLLGTHSVLSFNAANDDVARTKLGNMEIALVSHTHYDYSAPKFTLDAAIPNAVDLSCVLEDIKSCEQKLSVQPKPVASASEVATSESDEVQDWREWAEQNNIAIEVK